MTREEEIDYLTDFLKAVLKEYPQLRLGQILCELANYSAIYYISDKDLIKLLLGKYFSVKLARNEQKEEIKKEEKHIVVNNHKMPQNKGRIYIHNVEGKVKAIFKEDLDKFLKEGWIEGRK